MKTKDKILQTALNLFNEKGYNNVTTRDIATEMKISAGNLHYHFKHSEDLIIHFFTNLKLDMDHLLENLKNIQKKDLSDLYNYTQSSCEILYTYRFIFLNFVDILRKIPAIESQYAQLNIIRKEEFQSIFKDFQEDRIFKENIPNFILESLVTQIFIIGDNWITFNSLTLKLNKEESIKHYSIIFLNLFYPFLTDEQQKLYELNYIKS
ncbi:TetR/AcrR family transcriptional regulator [Chryseobacterium scophthalmum]|uniref:Transcriptional regulator, TetR family n=1 Tax=Chryseobacterium scophthalmum TaxID=59733 RepID=A0A1N6G6N7_9FLAO|nr:TetR/AcrR family transcriptional regulator [Chryseobacterium scophthalmum]SIO03072.1 transcriptional regulator, TetR family [Chryseobacterium scophthalmum]